jgi:hypothetical protein
LSSACRPRGKTPPRRAETEGGQSLVEFALIAPVFLLFVFMVIQGALYINAQVTIDNVTREVARAAAICGTQPTYDYRGQGAAPCSTVVQRQVDTNILPRTASSPLTIAVCSASIPSNGHCSSGFEAPTAVGQQVEIDVYYTYTFYLDPLLGQGGPTVQVNSSARVVAQQ